MGINELAWQYSDADREIKRLRQELAAHQGRKLEAENGLIEAMREGGIEALVACGLVFLIENDEIRTKLVHYGVDLKQEA